MTRAEKLKQRRIAIVALAPIMAEAADPKSTPLRVLVTRWNRTVTYLERVK